MKIAFTLIVVAHIVAQLPQLQAAPQGIASQLSAILQEMLHTEASSEGWPQASSDREVAELMAFGLERPNSRVHGFSSKNCPKPVVDTSGILPFLTQEFGCDGFSIEFHCANVTASCTTVTAFEGKKYHSQLELCDRGKDGAPCRKGKTSLIEIGPECGNVMVKGPWRIDIPLGNTGRTIGALVYAGRSSSGESFGCITVEGFGGPACDA